jgi:hypothetical protein
MSTPNLYIACGGSGCKTIRGLTELIAQDPKLRASFKNDIYFVLIDTEEEELNFTENFIRQRIPDLGFHNFRNIVKIQTSQTGEISANSLAPLVREAFDEKRHKPQDLDRLKRHWWFNDSKDSMLPFVAPGVSPLIKGAGQCPPVSYFLAWRMMGKIEEKLEALFNEIIENRGGDVTDGPGRIKNPLDGLNYHIISGLAGGTGRGCWELIAFKVKEFCVKRFGSAPKPRAILFDASVTTSVVGDGEQSELIAQKVNALTGYSQLDCWAQVKTQLRQTSKVEADFSFRLPSMTNPGKPEADVLVLDNSETGQEPPIDQVYIICATNETSHLSKSDDYYTMVGRALYAQLKSYAIDGSNVNKDNFYNSLGAASFEVAAHDITKYYESGARIAILEGLLEGDDDIVSNGIEEFLGEFRFQHGFASNSAKGLMPSGNEKEYSIWQKVVQSILDQKSVALGGFAVNLKESGDELDIRMEELQSCLVLSDDEVSNLVQDTFSQLGDFKQKSESILKKVYRRGNTANKVPRSIKNVDVFCDKIQNLLLGTSEGNRGFLKSLPKNLDGIQWDDPVAIFEKSKGRKYGVVGPRFEEGEIQAIVDSCGLAIVIKNYDAIRNAYTKASEDYLKPLLGIKNNAAEIIKRVEFVLSKELSQLKNAYDVSDAKSAHRSVFADPENPIDTQSDDPRRFVQRILKPALTPEQFKSQCQDSSVVQLKDDGVKLDSLCYDDLFIGRIANDKIGVGEDLQKTLSETVGIQESFVEDAYSLQKTVEGLKLAWQRYFEKLQSRDAKDEVAEVFMSIFGYKPDFEDNEVSLGNTLQMLKKMAASLASTTANYWLLDQQLTSTRVVNIIMPPIDNVNFKQDAGTWEKDLSDKMPSGSSVKIIAGGDAKSSNPFVLVTLHQHGTDLPAESDQRIPDLIRSLDYWSDTGVIDQLILCERPGSQNAIFKPAPGMNGVTFTDPIYIMNEAFSKKRWKPWYTSTAQEEEKAEESEKNKATMALLYLFMKPDGDIGRVIADKQWGMPVAEVKTTGTVRFTRNGVLWADGKVKEDRLSSIKDGEEIGKIRAGIAGVKQWLSSPEGSKALGSILAERDAFWKMLEEAEGINRNSKKAYTDLCDGIEATVDSLRKVATVNNQDAEDVVWDELIKAAQDRNQALI